MWKCKYKQKHSTPNRTYLASHSIKSKVSKVLWRSTALGYNYDLLKFETPNKNKPRWNEKHEYTWLIFSIPMKKQLRSVYVYDTKNAGSSSELGRPRTLNTVLSTILSVVSECISQFCPKAKVPFLNTNFI